MLFIVRQTLGSRTVKDESRLNFDPVMTAESGFTFGDSKIVSEILLHKLLQKYCSTQTCIPPGSLNRVPASAGVKAGMSPLPGGR